MTSTEALAGTDLAAWMHSGSEARSIKKETRELEVQESPTNPDAGIDFGVRASGRQERQVTSH